MPRYLKFTCFESSAFLLTDSEKVYEYYYYKKKYGGNHDNALSVDVLFPGISISECSPFSIEQNFVACLCHSGLIFDHIDSDKNIAVISRSEKDLNIRDINVLLSAILSKELNINAKAFLHCSAVAKKQNATLLLGGMGSGKTSLAVYLCRHYDCQLVCNDHAVVGIDDNMMPHIYCGTLSTVLRPGAVGLVVPELVSEIPKEMFKKPWKTQFVLNDYFTKLGITTKHGATVKNVIFVDIDEGKPCECSKVTFEKNFSRTMLDLHNALGECTRCNAKYLFGIDKVMPNFDDDETSLKRKEMAEIIINNTNVFDIHGNVRCVADEISKLL